MDNIKKKNFFLLVGFEHLILTALNENDEIFFTKELLINDINIKENFITLEKFLDENIFELEVLKGAQETIKKMSPKYVQFEFNWHQLFKNHNMYSFSKYLKEYQLFQILPFGHDLIKVDPNRPETNIYHLSKTLYSR